MRPDGLIGTAAGHERHLSHIVRHIQQFARTHSAHLVSPFGARGANSGIQDVENLAWKLKLVMDGTAPTRLLDSYDSERVYGADDNILNATRATDFITPKSAVSKLLRYAVLELPQPGGQIC